MTLMQQEFYAAAVTYSTRPSYQVRVNPAPPDRSTPALLISLIASCLVVLGLDEVRKGLGLLVSVVVVVAVVVVVVALGADELHLVDTAALGAALNRAIASDLAPSQHIVSHLHKNMLQRTVSQITP